MLVQKKKLSKKPKNTWPYVVKQILLHTRKGLVPDLDILDTQPETTLYVEAMKF